MLNNTEQNQHTEIMVKLGVIQSEVTELVRRVGIQNGRILKSEGDITILRQKDAFADGRNKGLWVFWSVLVASVAVVASVFAIISKWPS